MTALEETAWSTAALGAGGREDEWQEHSSPLISKREEKKREQSGELCLLHISSLTLRSLLPHPKLGESPKQMGAPTPSAGSRAASVPSALHCSELRARCSPTLPCPMPRACPWLGMGQKGGCPPALATETPGAGVQPLRVPLGTLLPA